MMQSSSLISCRSRQRSLYLQAFLATALLAVGGRVAAGRSLLGVTDPTGSFTYYDTPKTWVAARNFCLNNHYDLAGIASASEEQAVLSLAGTGKSVWIGFQGWNGWRFWDGTSADYTNWKVGEPGERPEMCATISDSGWESHRCNHGSLASYPFVCINHARGPAWYWGTDGQSCDAVCSDFGGMCTSDSEATMDADVRGSRALKAVLAQSEGGVEPSITTAYNDYNFPWVPGHFGPTIWYRSSTAALSDCSYAEGGKTRYCSCLVASLPKAQKWYWGGLGQSCTDVCSVNGGSCITESANVMSGVLKSHMLTSAMNKVVGGTAPVTSAVPTTSNDAAVPGYWGNTLWYRADPTTVSICDAAAADKTRLCSCLVDA